MCIGIWHEEIGDWILTYNKRRTGQKDILAATNLEKGIYLSSEEPEGMQDPLDTLYRSLEYPREDDMPERSEIKERDLSDYGIEILEENIREENESGNRDSSKARERMAAYDHERDPGDT